MPPGHGADSLRPCASICTSGSRVSVTNLPEARAGRWGEGLTPAKMKDCRWLKPVLIGQFEFLEWTPDKRLRHSRFVALKDDDHGRKSPRER